MKFFIDTANIEQIKEAEDMGILDGVTTNPSLMAKEGISGEENIINHYKTICEIVDGDVSAEVISTDYEGMVAEGEKLAALHKNIVVKVPMIKEGIKNGAVEHELSAHTGHISAALGHMANISHFIGKTASPEDCKDAINGNKMKLEVYERFAEHLDKNGVDLNKSKATLGPLLSFDPDKEVFTGDLSNDANELVKGDYRKGFQIPEVV